MQKQARIPGADLETVSALLRQLAPEAERPPAAVWIPHPVVCSILCTIVYVSGSISGLLFDFEKKQLKFLLDGDIVIQSLIFTDWKGIS